jgi:hypothetical protein
VIKLFDGSYLNVVLEARYRRRIIRSRLVGSGYNYCNNEISFIFSVLFRVLLAISSINSRFFFKCSDK